MHRGGLPCRRRFYILWITCRTCCSRAGWCRGGCWPPRPTAATAAGCCPGTSARCLVWHQHTGVSAFTLFRPSTHTTPPTHKCLPNSCMSRECHRGAFAYASHLEHEQTFVGMLEVNEEADWCRVRTDNGAEQVRARVGCLRGQLLQQRGVAEAQVALHEGVLVQGQCSPRRSCARRSPRLRVQDTRYSQICASLRCMVLQQRLDARPHSKEVPYTPDCKTTSVQPCTHRAGPSDMLTSTISTAPNPYNGMQS